jgi:periplasmic divalent cation tolerance protein
MNFCAVFTTTSSIDEAKTIAHNLVESKLAACVNIIPGVVSVYEWQDKINEEEECILFIKTQENLFERLKERILNIHSYELPEIIMLPIKDGHKQYLDWIEKTLLLN